MKNNHAIAAALARAEAEGRICSSRPRWVNISEKDFQAAVIAQARLFGWRVYHTHNSRRSVPGFPDLVLIRGHVLMVAELKVGKNKPTAEQLNWLEAFQAAGIASHCWRPENWTEIEKFLR